MFKEELLKNFYTGAGVSIVFISDNFSFIENAVGFYMDRELINKVRNIAPDVCTYVVSFESEQFEGFTLKTLHQKETSTIWVIDFQEINYNKRIEVYCENAKNSGVVIFGINQKKLIPNIINLDTEFYSSNIYQDNSNTKNRDQVSYYSYVIGYTALFLESRPLWNKNDIINYFYDHRQNLAEFVKVDIVEETNVDKINFYPNSSISILSLYKNDYLKYKNLIDNNIIEEIDLSKRQRNNIRNENMLNCEKLYIINPLHHVKNKLLCSSYIEKDIVYIGNIAEPSESFRGYYAKSNIVRNSDIKTPVILIVGVGMETGKFCIQLSLKNEMLKLGLNSQCITYNPLGYIFNMNVLKYDPNIPFPDMVFFINQYIKQLELNDVNNSQCFIINVGGGISGINKLHHNHFGVTYKAYLNATTIDFMVICINTITNINRLKYEIDTLKLLGFKNIALVISKYTYESTSLGIVDGPFVYLADYEDVENTLNRCKQILTDIPIFLQEEAENSELFKYIRTIIGNE